MRCFLIPDQYPALYPGKTVENLKYLALYPGLKTLEWWILRLMFDPLFLLIRD